MCSASQTVAQACFRSLTPRSRLCQRPQKRAFLGYIDPSAPEPRLLTRCNSLDFAPELIFVRDICVVASCRQSSPFDLLSGRRRDASVFPLLLKFSVKKGEYMSIYLKGCLRLVATLLKIADYKLAYDEFNHESATATASR